MEDCKILIVDDDVHICELLRLYIAKEGFSTIIAHDGVCKDIRKNSKVPIIMLTAKGETFDKVMGFELGADDYITKPFDTRELVYRIKAVLRRSLDGNTKTLKMVKYDNLTVNLSTYQLIVDGKEIDTPPKELEVLYHLASNPNKVFTRDQLLDEVWGFDYFGDSRTVDVHIKRIREKIDGISDNFALKTVWGVGYKFEVKYHETSTV